MSTVLLVIHVLLALALVGVILIQRNEGGLGGLGGGMSSFMTGRSASSMLTKATAVLAAAFMANSIALAIVTGVESGSILDVAGTIDAPAAVETPPEDNAGPTAPTD